MVYQKITMSWDGSTVTATPDPAPQPGQTSTPVEAGKDVQWVTGTGVTSIAAIYVSTANLNIFSTQPTEANSWKGTIANSPSEPVDSTESYCIAVNTANGVKVLDPTMKINPTK